MNKLAFALLALLPACHAVPVRGDASRRLGTIQFFDDPVRVVALDTVRAGVPFFVRVTTHGGGCVAQGDTEVEVRGSEARVTVYDLASDPGSFGVCTADVRKYEHTATLQFPRRGVAMLRVRGWKYPPGEEVTVTRRIVVQ